MNPVVWDVRHYGRRSAVDIDRGLVVVGRVPELVGLQENERLRVHFPVITTEILADQVDLVVADRLT